MIPRHIYQKLKNIRGEIAMFLLQNKVKCPEADHIFEKIEGLLFDMEAENDRYRLREEEK